MTTYRPNGAPANPLPGLFGPPNEVPQSQDVATLLMQAKRDLTPEARAALAARLLEPDAPTPSYKRAKRVKTAFGYPLGQHLEFDPHASSIRLNKKIAGRSINQTYPNVTQMNVERAAGALTAVKGACELVADVVAQFPEVTIRLKDSLVQTCDHLLTKTPDDVTVHPSARANRAVGDPAPRGDD